MADKKPIFTQESLEKINAPARLDELMTVTKRSSWLFLLSILWFVIMVIAWAFFGTINQEVTGPCVLYPATGGPIPVVADKEGYVHTLRMNIGQSFRAKENLLTLKQDKVLYQITSPDEAQILDVLVSTGQHLTPGIAVALIQPKPNQYPLVAHVFVPPKDGKLLRPGMRVHLAIDQANPAKYGYLEGIIDTVSTYPLTHHGLMQILRNQLLETMFVKPDIPPFEAIVRLHQNPQTPSGYEWTSERGYPEKISSGSLCHATIIRKQITPIQLFFPAAD
jgi:hypothetical protein